MVSEALIRVERAMGMSAAKGRTDLPSLSPNHPSGRRAERKRLAMLYSRLEITCTAPSILIVVRISGMQLLLNVALSTCRDSSRHFLPLFLFLFLSLLLLPPLFLRLSLHGC